MSSSSEPRIKTFKADGAIGQYRFVKPGSDENHVAQADVGSTPIGVAQVAAAAAEDKVEVHLLSGGTLVQLGGTVSGGDSLKPDANGKAIVASVDTNKAGALAMDAGILNDVVSAELDFHYIAG